MRTRAASASRRSKNEKYRLPTDKTFQTIVVSHLRAIFTRLLSTGGVRKNMTSKGPRRFSQASCMVTSYIHDLVSKDHSHDPENDLPYLETLSECSLSVLLGPPYGPNPEEDPFLTDKRMKSSLEEAGLINWCPGIKHLIPLAVTNDGNTLCHSASMALWGVHDRQLHLRRLVRQALQSQAQKDFRQRWQREVTASREKLHDSDISQDSEAEWQVLIQLTSESNKSVRSNNPLYEPLEEFHIFVLANVLRRPLLVFADRPIRSVEPQELTSCFAALYLPVLWKSQDCCPYPLVIGYCDNYFAPLITFGNPLEASGNTKELSPSVVPLVGIDRIPVENRYLTLEEDARKDDLIKEYLFTAEIEYTLLKVAHVMTAAKLVSNPMNETEKMISEYFRENQAKKQTTNTEAPPAARKLSKFRCGNKLCTRFIDQDHLFPYCSDCYPKLSSSVPQAPPARRKMNSAHTVVPPTSLEIECETVGCPYNAAVSCFPYCQRCKTLKDSSTGSVQPSISQNMSLEDRWQKLAMGVVDEQLVSGMMSAKIKDTEEELSFKNVHCPTLVEDGDKCAMGAATSTRSLPMNSAKPKPSATGARSGPPRKVSKEELLLATNAIDIEDSDWKRKVSWINEPCIRPSCPYFASTRTYPYCNQCASDLEKNPAPVPRNRKVSGTCTLPPVVQED